MQATDPRFLKQRLESVNLISRSLLYSLGRQHLDSPLPTAKFIQALPPPDRLLLEEPCFLRIDQIGGSVSGTFEHALTALQTTLSACHAPQQYTLIFLVTSDEHENHIYLGIRSHNYSSYDSVDFIKNIGNFLQGNWPGTRVSLCEESDPTFSREVLHPLRNNLRHAIALTGIPSPKHSDHAGYPQSLDRFLRGFRGQPFTYMVVAEAMPNNEVEEIIHRSRDLLSYVHALSKTTQTQTATASNSLSEGATLTNTKGTSTSTTFTEQLPSREDSGSELLKAFGYLAVGATGMALGFAPLEFAAALGVLPISHHRLRTDQNNSRSLTETSSETVAMGLSQTTTLSLSAAEAFGQEYVNAHAQAAEEQLTQFIRRFEQSRSLGCWNVGVYLLANRPDIAQQGGTQLRALLTGMKTASEPIRVHDLTRLWTKGVKTALHDFQQPCIGLVKTVNQEQKEKYTIADQVEHPLGTCFSRLTTPLNTEELALLVNLPQRQLPGIPLVATADFSLNVPALQTGDLVLGSLLDGGDVTSLKYPLSGKTLVKHTLVAGITGSGKSNTCLRILSELQQRHTPFLVIEPAKDEYVRWALQVNASLPPDSPDRVLVFMPGAQTFRGQKLDRVLHFNPLDIIWLHEAHAPQVLSHIDRLKSILNAAFPMQEALPILLEEVLFTVYSRLKWLETQLPDQDSPRPTLRSMYDTVQEVVKQKGYDERVTANLTAALMTRLQSLRRSWKGQLFDQPRSTPWQDLFDKPVVINLSLLGDDNDRAFAMAILLQFLHEYRQAQAELSEYPSDEAELKHLTVIEEAHRILLRAPATSLEQANPQAKVAEMFSNVLSEIRAYGEGLMLVDQVPARLIPDVIKNTNLKIVHRLVADDDRQAMGSCMTLTSTQTELMNRLRPGQAIVYGDQDDMAAWVQIDKQKVATAEKPQP
jgi:hypothetical protein